MEDNTHLSEEMLVDYTLKYLSVENKAFVEEHLTKCAKCKEALFKWEGLLDRTDQLQEPTNYLKDRLLQQIAPKRKTAFSIKKPLVVLSAVTAAFILFFVGYQIDPNKSTTISPPDDNSPFVVKEDTKIYEVIPVQTDSIQGYAWINPTSNEMLLFVDGLTPRNNNDYQAWIQTTQYLKNAGLLNMSGRKGQIYIKDGVIQDVKHIVVSKEPRGGSQTLTDPEPFLIRLNNTN